MDERKSWLREHWRTGLILVLIMGLAAFLRVYFAYNLFAPAGYWTGGGDYSGGSDPFYWERALLYSFQTGKEISRDFAMNYPLGFPDVRPPLFDWFNLLAGYLVSPAFPGGAWDAMVWMLNMNAAIFGVLTLIPTYLIGKEAFNRRAGLLAAFLLAISAAALQRSHVTIAVHDSWTLFFVVCAFYFYLRALKTLNRRRWVESWFHRASVTAGLRAFLQENRKSVLYAFLAGLSVGVTALSWQGWAYVPVLLGLTFLVEVILDRIRNQDAMGVTILFMIIQATPLVISLPWYVVRNQVHVWWDVPFYLFLVAAAVGIVFTVTRDYPWTIVLPATFLAGGAGLLVATVVNPSLLFAFYSGAGYFVKSKVYQTIAEAQEPGMSELVLNFGWFSFYVGLGAIAYLIWQIPKRNNAAYTMLVIWTFGALFMALSAARFIFNAAPVMAIATGYALDLILTRFGFEEMRRTYHSLSEGSWRNAVRKSVKPRHVIIALLLAFLIILPNAWFAVDAAIPYESKGTYDKQIQSMLPSFLQAPGFSSAVSSGGTFYLGAFGYSLPTSTQYFPAGYQWLSTQDTNLPLEQRPAVLAWWDYGFEIAERGGHPVPADPFQNGYAIAGQFIMAQNESSAITLLSLRLIEGDLATHGGQPSPGMVQVLTKYGINPTVVAFAFRNQASLAPIILNNPNVYGVWDSNLQPINAQYIYLEPLFVSRLTEEQIADLYHDIRGVTGSDIGYFMVDTRLFPISATNTGIFYAPAKLSDHRVLNLANGQVMPIDFFRLFANTNRGQNIPIQYVLPTDQVSSTSITYQTMFYKSMFYRAFVGYAPSDLGSNDTGIPGMDQALAQYQPEPAWNLTHFRLVYRTAYYNPYKDVSNHTTAWRAMNYDQALALQKQIQAGKATGVVDLSATTDIQNGLVILRYYDGALVNGTVTVGGVPLAGVHVTVTDELGTPHYVTTTDANGRYSAIAPFGNITITASVGALNRVTLIGASTLASTTFPISVDQAMRVNQDLNGDGVPDWLITKDLTTPAQSLHGTLYFDLNRDNAFNAGDPVAAGATLHVTDAAFPYRVNATVDAAGSYLLTNLVAGTYHATVTYRGHTVPLADITVSSTSGAHSDLPVPFGTLHGNTLDASGNPVGGSTVAVTDALNGTTWQTTSISDGTYNFEPVLPGNYTLTATAGQESSTPLFLSSGLQGSTQNLTLLPSGRVSGTTSLFGVALPYTTLQFQEVATPYVIATVTSDAGGAFGLTLPAGDWNVNGRVYQGNLLYVTIGRATVSPATTATFNANFVEGARVSGSVSAVGQTGDLRALIGFVGPNGEWWLRSALGNGYLAFLPTGSYSVIASIVGKASFSTLTLASSTTMDITLENATSLSGSVYWDMNRNGRADPGEGIAGARITLTDDLGRPDIAVTDATGAFTIQLIANRTYSGQVTASGFYPMPINATNAAGIGPNVRWALTPIPVTVTGTVFLNGTALLNHPITILAEPRAGGAQSAQGTSRTDGSYSLTLTPGAYRLVVDENISSASNAWRYQNLGTDSVRLAVGAAATSHDLVIVVRALVKGNVTLAGVGEAGTVTFRGIDITTVQANATTGFQTYLRPGTYSVGANRSVSGTVYAVLQNATLPMTGSVTLALAAATRAAGHLLYGGSNVTSTLAISFVRKEGGLTTANSTADGSYFAYLVPGNYTVSVDGTANVSAGGGVQYFRYIFQGTLTVPPSTPAVTDDLHLTRTYDNTTVSGLVTISGMGVDASLSFHAASGAAITAQVSVPTNGTFRVSLAPGTYDVYATRAVGSAAFLGPLVVPHAAVTFNVPLGPAFLLSGGVTGPTGSGVRANLTIIGAAHLSLPTDASGSFSLLLPQGFYTVQAARNQTEQGVVVSYEGSADLNLVSDTVANLQLGRVDQRSVVLTWDPSQNRTIQPGGSVTYSLRVQNTGNTADTYSLTGNAAGWSFAFSPSTVSLDYGTARNATVVTVTIQAPANALVNHGSITLTATSATDSTVTARMQVQVGITRVRGLTVQIDPLSGTFDGTYLNYTVNVRNTGNDVEVVDVLIQNPSDIAANGWSAGLARTGQTQPAGLALTNVTVAANATTPVRLILRLNGAHGGATVALQVVAENAPGVNAQTVYTVALPQLSTTTGIGVSGPGVALSLPPNAILLAAIVGAAAAVGVGLFLTRRRR